MPPPQPYDDEEGVSSASVPASGSRAGETVAPPLSWGEIGLNTVEKTSDGSNLPAVVRIVEGGVEFVRPPLDGPFWSLGNRPQRYEMAWTLPTPPNKVETFQSLGVTLRQAADEAGGTLPRNHPLLGKLDEAVELLLRAIDKLHREDWRCGLLTPNNILLIDDGRRRDVLLIDLGFSWRGRIGEPAWLRNNSASALWDEPPARRQFAQPGTTDPVPVPSDVRTIGRIFGSMMTFGTPKRAIDLPDGASGAIWDVLRKATSDAPHASIESLRQALVRTPLSSRFLKPPPPPPPPPMPPTEPPIETGSSLWPALGSILALTAIGGGIYYIMNESPPVEPPPQQKPAVDVAQVPPSPTPTSPTPPMTGGARPKETDAKPNDSKQADSPKKNDLEFEPIPTPQGQPTEEFTKLLREFEAAKPEERAAIVTRAYQFPKHADPAIERAHEEWRLKLRDEWRRGWVPRLQAAVNIALDPSERITAIRAIRKLNTEFAAAVQGWPAVGSPIQERETRCREFSTLRLNELENVR